MSTSIIQTLLLILVKMIVETAIYKTRPSFYRLSLYRMAKLSCIKTNGSGKNRAWMDRAFHGYNTGIMGEIFRKVAAISPLYTTATTITNTKMTVIKDGSGNVEDDNRPELTCDDPRIQQQ